MPNQCQHECRNSPGSYRCLCPPGYRLLPNGKTCHGQYGGGGAMPLPWWHSCVPRGVNPVPAVSWMSPLWDCKSFSFRGMVIPRLSTLPSLGAFVSLPPCRSPQAGVGSGDVNPHLSLGHRGTLAPSNMCPLCPQTWMSARRARSSVARARCASTPVEVPSAWMCRVRPGTGEAPALGESCCGVGGPHPALLVPPWTQVSWLLLTSRCTPCPPLALVQAVCRWLHPRLRLSWSPHAAVRAAHPAPRHRRWP